jgi:hypothetical protein
MIQDTYLHEAIQRNPVPSEGFAKLLDQSHYFHLGRSVSRHIQYHCGRWIRHFELSRCNRWPRYSRLPTVASIYFDDISKPLGVISVIIVQRICTK